MDSVEAAREWTSPEGLLQNRHSRLAVLIYADNGQSTVVAELMAEVARYGTAAIKRAHLAALDVTAREDGRASLAALGSQLTRNNPSFDSRNYQRAKLGDLMRMQPNLELRDGAVGEGDGSGHLYVRRRSGEGAGPIQKFEPAPHPTLPNCPSTPSFD